MITKLVNLILLVSASITTWGAVCITPQAWSTKELPTQVVTIILWLVIALTWFAMLKVCREEVDDSK